MSDFISQLAALAGIDTLMQALTLGTTVASSCQGLNPVNFRITAFLWGQDWKQQLKALITAFKASGPGELIHPVYGLFSAHSFSKLALRSRMKR